MTTHTMSTCPTCDARRVPGASACWQCGGTFTAAAPSTAPASPLRWVKVPWVGVIPSGLFFLPWVVAGRYGVHRVISISGLELALGRTLRGRSIPHEPILWLIPIASLLLAALLFRAYRRTSVAQHWLLVATVAWTGFLLLLFKAVQWLWIGSASETVWVVHWLTTEYLVTVGAFGVSGLTATRVWMRQRRPQPQSSSTPSQHTPLDEGQIR